MPVLEGSIENIVFRNEDNHYTVARFRPNDGGRLFRDDVITIVGMLPRVNIGEVLSVEGEWENDPRYGLQLHITNHTVRPPTSKEGIVRYLSSGLIKGIGPKKAERIVEHFGEQTLAIIEQQPERLREVKGLSQKDCDRIINAWQEQGEIKELHLFLQDCDISINQATRIYKQYGKDAIKVLRENPYQLAREVTGIGFSMADEIARKVADKLKLDFQPDSAQRLAIGLKYVLEDAAEKDGHCFLPENELLARASRALKVPVEALTAGMDLLRGERDMFIEPPPAMEKSEADTQANAPAALVPASEVEVDTEGLEQPEAQPRVYFGTFWHAENGSARLLRILLHSPSSLPRTSQQQWDRIFTYLKQNRKMQLTDKQREAVQMAYNKKVSILTGGPGTGKTTSLRALLLLLRKRNIDFALAAPTGRAARRLAEATGCPAKTLHRLLEYIPHDNGWLRNESNPLPYKFVIVDEFSMVDIFLFYNLLKALPRDAHLLLVGDADQLPSVGPGNVLRDLLRSEAIPSVRLTDLFRQAQQSKIIVNAHRINGGEMPLIQKEKTGDFFFFPEEEPIRIQHLLLDLVQNRMPRTFHLNPLTDIQVLAPMYRGPAGVTSLNEELQARLNPRTFGQLELHGATWRVGDKVMQVRNNYDKGVFNGDVGRIRYINSEDEMLKVEFVEESGTTLVEYDFHELRDELVLAYAITIHKSQGSEYPAVVIPLTTEHGLLLQRNLLYTAITRAKRLCVLVGQPRALRLAVRNERVMQRNTGLAERLKPQSNGRALYDLMEMEGLPF
ncbi:MAG TPA: ATP-dependent RecD-like DNA helicase [Ktedonobacteraceae bacterium]|nr:ATP-dependent RecD-like DNA helicase [Ktedonobacteraceae bacterium]